MTSKTPEQIAEELYPYSSGLLTVAFDFNEVVDAKRDVWLSRQAEVNEGIKKYKEADEHARNMEAMVDELKKIMAIDKDQKSKWWQELQETKKQLAAKEKEIEGLSEAATGLTLRCKEHLEEIKAKDQHIKELEDDNEYAFSLVREKEDTIIAQKEEIKEVYEQLGAAIRSYGDKIIAKGKQIAIMESLLNDYSEQIDKLTSKDETAEQGPQSGDQTT